MKNIAIIPARSGSKGLLNKNIKLLNGKPLMAYTIEAAVKSHIFESIVVSTDSEEYAAIAREYGATVPFLRSEELSGDQVGTWDVVKEVVASLEELDKYYDNIVVLQPTSPLRNEKHIQAAYELYNKNMADSVVGVSETNHSPLWTNTLPDNMSLNNFIAADIRNIPRQQLPPYYIINGAIYIIRRQLLNKKIDLYKEHSYAYIMDQDASIDIDTRLDFIVAEAIMDR